MILKAERSAKEDDRRPRRIAAQTAGLIKNLQNHYSGNPYGHGRGGGGGHKPLMRIFTAIG